MNKTELVASTSEVAGVAKKDTEKVLNAFFQTVMEEVKQGGDVQIIGFGTFTTSHRQEREGKNPRTGEPIKIAAKLVPKFKPGKAFKDRL